MNEIKKLIVVLVVFAATVLFTGAVSYKRYAEDKKIYDDFVEQFNSNEITLFYIGRPTCGYCNLLNIGLEEMELRYHFKHYYINTDETSSDVINKIAEHFNLTNIATPYLAVVSNGKIKNVQNGYAEYEQLFKFLQQNGVISSDATLALNYIGLNEYKTKLAENKFNIMVVGQNINQYSAAAKVVLNQLVDQTKLQVNYLSVSDLTESELKDFRASLSYFNQGFSTPTMIITKNGALVAKLEGLASYEQYTQFLKQNGVL